MCQYFSCIATQNLKVLWSDRYCDHNQLIQDAKLKDDKLVDRNFVRIEITPKNAKKVTRKRKDWVLKVDEEATLPEWYERNKREAEENCWKAWTKSVKTQLAIDSEEISVKDRYVVAYGSSTVKASDSSTVEAYGSSTVEASDSSTVKIKSDFATVHDKRTGTIVVRNKQLVRVAKEVSP